MKTGRETLLTLLEAFVYDPLVDWATSSASDGQSAAVLLALARGKYGRICYCFLFRFCCFFNKYLFRPFLHFFFHTYLRLQHTYLRLQHTYLRLQHTYLRLQFHTYLRLQFNTYLRLQHTYLRLQFNTYLRLQFNTYLRLQHTYLRLQHTYLRLQHTYLRLQFNTLI